MTSRIAALSIGLAVGIASFLFMEFDWTEVLAFLARQDRTGLGAALTDHWPRVAWTGVGATTLFALASLLAALVGGLGETLTARARISALRYDSSLAETWNAADWRAAFARTAVAGRADAMIAATIPAVEGSARRVVVDTHLLIGMDQFWLDRLSLARIMTPLPSLVAGFATALALLAFVEGDRWEAVLAAGAVGWFAIRLSEYLVRLVLSAAVAAAVESATATLRPMISSRIFVPPGRSEIAPARVDAPTAPSPAKAAAPPATEPSREQTVEAAMPEIRASIERLLSGNPASPPPSP